MADSSSKIFVIGLAGGAIGSFLILGLSMFDNNSDAILTGNINNSAGTSMVSVTPPAVSAPDFWENIVANNSTDISAIQVFVDNKLFFQGSGIILSSDGLIVIPAALAVKGGIYQAAYDGKIYTGTVVKFDSSKNLALLKINASGLDVADFGRVQYGSGQDVVVVSKMVDISGGVVPASQRGTISYSNDNSVVLDISQNIRLIGGKVINSRGDFLGMLFTRSGQMQIIKSEAIGNFFENYISSL